MMQRPQFQWGKKAWMYWLKIQNKKFILNSDIRIKDKSYLRKLKNEKWNSNSRNMIAKIVRAIL